MSERVWESLLEAHDRVAAPAGGTAPDHQPVAAVLACSDARVPPSVVFDQPAGTLFVVRIAGNTASPAALASLDYAVAALGVELLIVLGHTDCGAVTAAASGTCGGHLGPIVMPICEIAREVPGASIDAIAGRNVVAAMRTLADHAGPVGQAARTGRLEIRGAIHDLRSGRLEPIAIDSPAPAPSAPRTTPTPAPQEAS
jgi:carbonic anhydrase